MNTIRNWIVSGSEHKWGQRIGLFLLIAGFVYLFFQTFDLDFSDTGMDFSLFWESAIHVANAASPYQGMIEAPYTSYLYPPVLAFLLIPLTGLPMLAGGIIWFILNTAAFFGVIRLTALLHRENNTSSPPPAKYLLLFFLVLLMYVPLQNHLKNGQVNLIVLYISMLSVFFYSKQSNVPAGISLALAIAIKPLPVFLFCFYLIRREWLLTGTTLLCTVLFLLMPYLTMQGELFEAYRVYFYTLFYVLPADNYLKYEFQIHTTFYDIINYFASTPSIWIRQCTNVLLLLFLIGIDVFGLSHRKANQAAVISLYLLMTLLILPISEKHHLVLMLPGVYIVCRRALYTSCKGILCFQTSILLFVFTFLSARQFSGAPVFSISVVMLIALVFYSIRSSQTQSK